MYDPASGRHIDDVLTTNGDISDPDKRFKRGFGWFAAIVMLVACGVSGGNRIVIIAAVVGVAAILGGLLALSLYDDRRTIRRSLRR